MKGEALYSDLGRDDMSSVSFGCTSLVELHDGDMQELSRNVRLF